MRLVHHAMAKPDEMVTRLLAHFKERLVPGEEAVALRNGAPAPCIVVQSLGPDGLDAGGPSSARASRPNGPLCPLGHITYSFFVMPAAPSGTMREFCCG